MFLTVYHADSCSCCVSHVLALQELCHNKLQGLSQQCISCGKLADSKAACDWLDIYIIMSNGLAHLPWNLWSCCGAIALECQPVFEGKGTKKPVSNRSYCSSATDRCQIPQRANEALGQGSPTALQTSSCNESTARRKECRTDT